MNTQTPAYDSPEAADLPTEPDFRRTRPQVIRDDWRRTVRVCTYDGQCVVCGTRAYTFEDGENDPRGALGDHAGSALTAKDDGPGQQGPDVPVCFGCMNVEWSYIEALRIARRRWDWQRRHGVR
jgi:hypothetical protein